MTGRLPMRISRGKLNLLHCLTRDYSPIAMLMYKTKNDLAPQQSKAFFVKNNIDP